MSKNHDSAHPEHPPTAHRNGLSEAIIGAAIEVHRTLGPGLLKSTYEVCLCQELVLRSIPFERQVALSVEYKGTTMIVLIAHPA